MKKKILPNMAQKLPMLEIINPIAEIINKIQPIRLIVLLLIFFSPTLKISLRVGI